MLNLSDDYPEGGCNQRETGSSLWLSQDAGLKAQGMMENIVSGEIPECALPHPDRIPKEFPFFNKPGNREGKFPGDVR